MTTEQAEDTILDFSGAPPAEGPISDYIPPGTYVIAAREAFLATSKQGKPMVDVRLEVTRGDYKDKRLRDLFTIPQANSNDTLFGLQRLNSLLFACKGKAAKGRNKLSSVYGVILNTEVIADVDDRELPPRDGGSALIVSNIVAYHYPKSETGQARIAALREGQPTPVAEAAPPAPPAEAAPLEDELAGDLDELASEPAPDAPAVDAVAAATAEAPAVEEEDLEDLFAD